MSIVKQFVYFICIIILSLFICGCATVQQDNIKFTPYCSNWCIKCGNTGWIACDNCWEGKMLDGSLCWKCKGVGKLQCPKVKREE